MTSAEFKTIQVELGFDNNEIAERLRVNVSTIEHWRSGRRNMSDRMANAVMLLREVSARRTTEDEPTPSKEGLNASENSAAE